MKTVLLVLLLIGLVFSTGGYRPERIEDLEQGVLSDVIEQLKVRINHAGVMLLTNASNLRCQIVAGKQCKIIFEFEITEHIHQFEVTFLMKLDHTNQIMNIQELNEIQE